ncbi:hypothetical protein PR048_018711 [Dryococelus australis]|uniref:Uncharacterized protein n=1 Tax=Dryococelus australis TaxID=614101 RepID=A0ABQ9HD35_9NEOP|nr:hypothetical protein PR048_018711 [Dryococelus australis]
MQRRGKREIPEKTRLPAASSSTIPTCGDSGLDGAVLYLLQLDGAVLYLLQLDCAVLYLLQLDCAVLYLLQLDCSVLYFFQLDCAVLYLLQLDCAVLYLLQLDCAVLYLLQLDGAVLYLLQLDCAVLYLLQLDGEVLYLLQLDCAVLHRLAGSGGECVGGVAAGASGRLLPPPKATTMLNNFCQPFSKYCPKLHGEASSVDERGGWGRGNKLSTGREKGRGVMQNAENASAPTCARKKRPDRTRQQLDLFLKRGGGGGPPSASRPSLRHLQRARPPPSTHHPCRHSIGAAVAQWLKLSPPNKANRTRLPAGSVLDFWHVGISPDDATGEGVQCQNTNSRSRGPKFHSLYGYPRFEFQCYPKSLQQISRTPCFAWADAFLPYLLSTRRLNNT